MTPESTLKREGLARLKKGRWPRQAEEQLEQSKRHNAVQYIQDMSDWALLQDSGEMR